MNYQTNVIESQGNFFLSVVSKSTGEVQFIITWGKRDRYGFSRWRYPSGFITNWFGHIDTRYGKWRFTRGLSKGHKALHKIYRKWLAKEEATAKAKETLDILVSGGKHAILDGSCVQEGHTEETY